MDGLPLISTSKNGIQFTKWCCNEPTHFPQKMTACEDFSHDAAAKLGTNTPLDAIITVGPLEVRDVKVFKNGPEKPPKTPEMPVYDHTAIQCTVNGLIIFSLNLEGRCDMIRSKKMHEMRWGQLKAVVSRLRPFPDIFCLQELFLRSNMPDDLKERRQLANKIMREMLGVYQDYFVYIYDDFTGGTIVNRKCIIFDKKMRPRSRFIERYQENEKKCTVIHVYNGKTSFFVVNVHLKAIQTSFDGDSWHKKEVSNLLANLQEELKVGVVFIGDHNTTHPEQVYAQAGGKHFSRKKHKRKSTKNKYLYNFSQKR